MQNHIIPSPLGLIHLTEEAGAITKLRWRAEMPSACNQSANTPLLQDASEQIAAYFDGALTEFDLPLRPGGSESQKRACAAMADISFGETRTYGELARALGVSAQAMGQLCGGNPIPILIPCHRVLGAQNLGGFSGGRGVEDKVWLLRHEGAAGLLI